MAPTLDTAAYALLPIPVAWCDGLGNWLGCNPAFAAYTGCEPAAGAPGPLPGALGALGALGANGASEASGLPRTMASAQQLHTVLTAGRDVDALPWYGLNSSGHALTARLSLRCLAGWRIVTLLPQPGVDADAGPPSGHTDDQTLLDCLDTTQRLALFGTWTLDLRTGERHWDTQMWRFWGHSPQPGALPVDQTIAAIHPDDRAEAVAVQGQSLRVPGRYMHRYRVLGTTGDAVRLRSLWQVFGDAAGQPTDVRGIVIDDTETFRLVRSASDAQSQLSLVLALADIAIWQHDQASGLLHTSALGWALLGLPSQPHGLPLALAVDRLDTQSRRALQVQLGAIDVDITTGDDGAAELELRSRRPDGRWRTLLTRGLRQRDAQERPCGHVGVLLDLSDRFDAQQEALALAQRLEMATAAAGVGVWNAVLTDPPRVHWDAQMRLLHGLPPDACAPTPCQYMNTQVHEADRMSVRHSMDVLLQRSEGLLDLDLRVIRPDGQVRRLATRSSVSGPPGQRQMNGVMLDVTERHATEDRLREAIERAALAARGAGIGTWESAYDTRNGWWDMQMFRLRGIDHAPGMVSSDEMMRWVHPDDRDLLQRQLQAAIREDGPANYEFRVVWPDGTLRWLASRSTPVRDAAGHTVRRIGINWDITDARNAEAARQERLLAQRESQAKARFLARISHELRTPLNAVLGFSQLLLTETAEGHTPNPATWRSRVTQVQASGEHLLALIDDVLELSSLESGELPLSLQAVALAPLVQSSLPFVELLASQHQVQLCVDALDGWVLADPVRLRQVLLNLLSNAIKYNKSGGRVTISAEHSDGWWLLRVQDTGRGLREDQLQHLFEPFNRLGAERDGIAGTGIGLAIVQAAVQHMGGTVQVRSTPGTGSVFELALQQAATPQAAPAVADAITLPLPVQPMLPPTLLATPPPTVPPNTSGERHRLLYIEDNEVNMMIVRELVRQRPDLDFDGAVDGASGLALARSLQPALILLDMQLPDMDGHAVLQALRADPGTAGIRCVALSANAMPEDIRIALAEGFDDYWTKPLDLAAFLRALARQFGPAPALPN